MTLRILISVCCEATIRADEQGCAVCNACNQRTYYKPLTSTRRVRPVA